jgi:N-acetylneuraminate synthase
MSKAVTIVAEIGINANGSIEHTKKLIDSAVEAGCDVVKFQKRNPDVCVPEHQKNIMRQTPWGEMTYLDYKYKVEYSLDDYKEIDSYCKSNNIQWTASPWDLDSLQFLLDFDVPFIKLPSAMLTNVELLKACKESGKPIVISTGMSESVEIKQAVDILGEKNLTILHCNSTYPAPVTELNLSCITSLKEKYPKAKIGYSGHELSLNTTISSVALGAEFIERHITLDKKNWGTDQSCSVEPDQLKELVVGIREVERALGDGVKVITDSEKIIRNKLRG